MKEIFTKILTEGFRTSKVESILPYHHDGHLAVATTDGLLMTYDHIQDSSSTSSSKYRCRPLENIRKQSKDKKSITNIVHLPRWNCLACIVDGIFTIYEAHYDYKKPQYQPRSATLMVPLVSFNEIKQVVSFSVDEENDHLVLCVLNKKKYTLNHFIKKNNYSNPSTATFNTSLNFSSTSVNFPYNFLFHKEIVLNNYTEAPKNIVLLPTGVVLSQKKFYEYVDFEQNEAERDKLINNMTDINLMSNNSYRIADIEKEHRNLVIKLPGTYTRPPCLLLSLGLQAIFWPIPSSFSKITSPLLSPRLSFTSLPVTSTVLSPFLLTLTLDNHIEVHDLGHLGQLWQRIPLNSSSSISPTNSSGGTLSGVVNAVGGLIASSNTTSVNTSSLLASSSDLGLFRPYVNFKQLAVKKDDNEEDNSFLSKKEKSYSSSPTPNVSYQAFLCFNDTLYTLRMKPLDLLIKNFLSENFFEEAVNLFLACFPYSNSPPLNSTQLNSSASCVASIIPPLISQCFTSATNPFLTNSLIFSNIENFTFLLTSVDYHNLFVLSGESAILHCEFEKAINYFLIGNATLYEVLRCFPDFLPVCFHNEIKIKKGMSINLISSGQNASSAASNSVLQARAAAALVRFCESNRLQVIRKAQLAERKKNTGIMFNNFSSSVNSNLNQNSAIPPHLANIASSNTASPIISYYQFVHKVFYDIDQQFNETSDENFLFDNPSATNYDNNFQTIDTYLYQASLLDSTLCFAYLNCNPVRKQDLIYMFAASCAFTSEIYPNFSLPYLKQEEIQALQLEQLLLQFSNQHLLHNNNYHFNSFPVLSLTGTNPSQSSTSIVLPSIITNYNPMIVLLPNFCHIESCSLFLSSHSTTYTEVLLLLYRSHNLHQQILSYINNDYQEKKKIESKSSSLNATNSSIVQNLLWKQEEFYKWIADYLHYCWYHEEDASLPKQALLNLHSLLEYDAYLALQVLVQPYSSPSLLTKNSYKKFNDSSDSFYSSNSSINPSNPTSSNLSTGSSFGGKGVTIHEVLTFLQKSNPKMRYSKDSFSLNANNTPPLPVNANNKSTPAISTILSSLPLCDGQALSVAFVECLLSSGEAPNLLHDEFIVLLYNSMLISLGKIVQDRNPSEKKDKVKKEDGEENENDGGYQHPSATENYDTETRIMLNQNDLTLNTNDPENILMFKIYRKKLQNFLKFSLNFNNKKFLKLFHSNFLYELSLLHNNLKNYNKVFLIYLLKLRNFTLAKDYCLLLYKIYVNVLYLNSKFHTIHRDNFTSPSLITSPSATSGASPTPNVSSHSLSIPLLTSTNTSSNNIGNSNSITLSEFSQFFSDKTDCINESNYKNFIGNINEMENIFYILFETMFEIYSYNSNNYEEDELFPEHLRNSPSYYDIHTNPLDLIIDLSTKHYEKINILNLLDLLKKNNEEENSIKLHKLLPLFLLKIEHLSSKKKNLQIVHQLIRTREVNQRVEHYKNKSEKEAE